MENNKVSNFFNTMSGLKEKVKSRIPESCTQIAERMHIRRQNEHEMGTFRTFAHPDGTMGQHQTNQIYGEYQETAEGSNGYYNTGGEGEIDIHTGMSGKISAWQAGWNVTNAIQVTQTTIMQQC